MYLFKLLTAVHRKKIQRSIKCVSKEKTLSFIYSNKNNSQKSVM